MNGSWRSASGGCGKWSTSWTCALKKSLRVEQGIPRIQELRANWPSTVAEIDAQRLIFVDESGITTEMTRRYGREASTASKFDPAIVVRACRSLLSQRESGTPGINQGAPLSFSIM